MMTDSILNIVFLIVDYILAPVDLLNWGFNLFYLSPLFDILKVIYFVVPIDRIAPIIHFIIAMFCFRGVIALIKTIWDLLPVL